jgi:hypothetical protein
VSQSGILKPEACQQATSGSEPNVLKVGVSIERQKPSKDIVNSFNSGEEEEFLKG